MMLFILVIAIFSPSLRIGPGINVNLIDFLPGLYLFSLFISTRRPPFRDFRQFYLVFVFMSGMIILSAGIGSIVQNDSLGSLKVFMQVYRRCAVFLFVPLILERLHTSRSPISLLPCLNMISISSGIIGISFNLFPTFRNWWLGSFDNSAQTVALSFVRNMGTVGEASYFSIMLALVILYNFYRPTPKAVWVLPVLFALMISTFSKSTIGTTFFVAIIYSFISSRKLLALKIWAMTASLIVVASVAALLIVAASGFDLVSIMNQYFGLSAKSSFSGRSHSLWPAAIAIMSQSWTTYFLGFGMKGLKSYYSLEGAHNMYLTAVADLGLIGGSVYLIWFIFLLPLWIWIRTRSLFAICVCCLIAVQSMVHEPLFHVQVLGVLVLIFTTELLNFSRVKMISSEEK